MSSSAKQVKVSSREVRTNSAGRRYVDMAEVIESELRRIDENKRAARNEEPQPEKSPKHDRD